MTRHAREIVDGLEMLLGEDMVLDTLSRCLRAMIIAGPGKKLVGGDFSNIEGRVNAWLPGEETKLERFRAYDAGLGPDSYKTTAGDILGKHHSAVTKAERQAYGKVPELACGYQGGVGAFVTMAATYLINVADVAKIATQTASPDALKLAQLQYARAANTYGLAQDAWVGVKLVVNGWRDAHPKIVQGWWDLQDAAIEAVGTPGAKVSVFGARVQYLVANGFLFCALPSARVIAYAAPRLKWSTNGQGNKRRYVEFDGLDSETRRWGPQSLYGGFQDENIVQAISRDVMVVAMHAAEAHGYPLVLTVHDELLCEVDDTPAKNAEGLREIMSRLPTWAHGLPLAAAAWEDKRYVK